ncbi:Uncharacterised protein [Serratia marcescens]|nr:Uncharacterised protein [Serratia marcescens]CVF59448.1 Uncharacterised protein [Serratia marcescens]
MAELVSQQGNDRGKGCLLHGIGALPAEVKGIQQVKEQHAGGVRMLETQKIGMRDRVMSIAVVTVGQGVHATALTGRRPAKDNT